MGASGRMNGSDALHEYVQQKGVWINAGTQLVANPSRASISLAARGSNS